MRIAIVVGLVALLAGGGVLALVLLGGFGAFRGDGEPGQQGGPLPANLIAHAPNDTFRLEYANVKDQIKVLGDKKKLYHIPGGDNLEKDLGSLENIEQVLVATTKTGRVQVVTSSRPIDQVKFLAEGKELDVDGKKYHELKRPERFPVYTYFPSDTMLVQTENEELLKKVLRGEAGKLTEPLPEFVSKGAGHFSTIMKPGSGPMVCSLESKNWSKDQVHFYWKYEYVNEEEARKGRPFYDDLARAPKDRSAKMTVERDGKYIIVNASGPAATLAKGW